MSKLLALVISGLLLLALSPAPATSQAVLVRPGTIKGVVLASNGQPVFGIQVRLAKVTRKHKATNTSTDPTLDLAIIHRHGLATTSTLKDGSFIFAGVQPGEHRVVAGNKTIGRGHVDVNVTGGQTSTVQIRLEPVVN